MKKAIVIILLILPVFLLITIAFAGRILVSYQHIYVEKIVFIDQSHNELPSLIQVGVGETKRVVAKVYPEKASNPAVVYSVDDETVLTVSETGELRGLKTGTVTLLAKALDNNVTAYIRVSVTNENVTGVTLSAKEVNMAVGEAKSLSAQILPNTAVNKSVIWVSDNPAVATVSANGRVTALAKGVANITVQTVDGGYEDTCQVTVGDFDTKLSFDLIPNAGILYYTNENVIVLKDHIVVGSGIATDDVHFAITSGSGIAEIDQNGTLTITAKNNLVKIKAYVGDLQNPLYEAELSLVWQ